MPVFSHVQSRAGCHDEWQAATSVTAASVAHDNNASALLQMREVRDPKQVTIPVLARLAVLVEDNDEMRSYFVAAGGSPRLSQLAAADHPPLKGGLQPPYQNVFAPSAAFGV